MVNAVRRYALLHWIGSVIVLTAVMTPLAKADWPQFRGPNSSGLGSGSPPTEFGPNKNVLWKTEVGAGHSSPCLFGDSIFLTTFDQPSKRVGVLRLDRKTGRVIWRRDTEVPKFEKGHPSFNPASSSPATDGKNVVAYFGSHGLVCYDLAGDKKWEIKMPLARTFGGNAASPIINGNRIILYRGNYVDHFVLAVDKTTGEELWRVDQAEPFTGEMACTACPIVADEKLIVHSARSVQAFDIATGKRLWVAKCATTATSTPILAGNEVLVAAWNKMGEPALRPQFPTFEELLSKSDKNKDKQINRGELPKIWIFHRPDGAEAPLNGATIRFDWADKDRNGQLDANEWAKQIGDLEKFRGGYKTHGLLAIPVASSGIVDADQIRTLETQGIPEVPSPLCDGQYVYLIKNGGVLTCLELKTGKRVYRFRTKGRGTHYASPLIAGGHIYTIAGDGKISVITLGPKPKIVAINDMRDEVYASPAAVGDVLYVRTHSALYAFGDE